MKNKFYKFKLGTSYYLNVKPSKNIKLNEKKMHHDLFPSKNKLLFTVGYSDVE